MKKIIAVFMACLMLFSVVIVPGFASEVDNSVVAEDEIIENEANTVTKSMGKFLLSIVQSIHSAIHQLFELFGGDCILCNE